MSTGELPYIGGALVLAHFSIKSHRITILRFAGLKYPCGFYPSYLLVMIHFNWQLDITIMSWRESQGGLSALCWPPDMSVRVVLS